MAKAAQFPLLAGFTANIRGKERVFGGATLGKSARSHAKRARPLDSKAPIHLVMRSSHAQGPTSMLRYARQVQAILANCAVRSGVEVLNFANVGNHLHLIFKVRSPRRYRAFIRAFSARVSRLMTGAHKYNKVGIAFWDQRPFTRVLASAGRPLQLLRSYLQKNKLEALGFTAPSARTLLALGLASKVLAAPS